MYMDVTGGFSIHFIIPTLHHSSISCNHIMLPNNCAESISTPNLLLRMLRTSDADGLQQLLERNREHMIPWVPWAKDEPESVEMKKLKIRIWKGEFYHDDKYVYGVFNSNQLLIGLAFMFKRQGTGTLEIGYIIDHHHSGKGFASECTYALTKLGIQYLKTDKMLIICNSKNKASARIPEKLGYNLEYIQKLVDRDEEGDRIDNMVWTMFAEGFEETASFEPVAWRLED